ncbi:hypothetical protein BSKO_07634 [Bryopsis sp. KO-2023]|nr:hypothetical protein BSKO_07634 [Bryopsis sp. KO-2023]
MNVPLDAMGDLPDEHKQQLLRAIEVAQVRDSMRLYNSLVERCFTSCVDTFRSKNLDSSEEKCVSRCAEKFLGLSGRVGLRFQEFSAEQEKKQMEQLQQMQRGMR